MKTKKMITRFQFLEVALGILILFGVHTTYTQQIKWLRVTQLQTPVNEIGAEFENEFTDGNTNFLSWPAQYGIGQNTIRCRGLWIGCRNFDDPVEGKIKNFKVIDVGPRVGSYSTKIFPQVIKLIGKKNHPIVTVDDQLASVLNSYDLVDEVDPNLECDREVFVKFNTSVGITVTKKTMAFDQSKNDNYHVKDFVFKNTGIYDAAGHVKQQTLDSVYFYFCDRYSFAGVSSTGFGLGWGSWNSTWGESNMNHSVGGDPNAPDFNNSGSPLYQLRAAYTWYGPDFERTQVSYAEDWGNPDQLETGELASAKYAGTVTLHADKSTSDRSDDPWQPRTNNFISADLIIMNKDVSQYDETVMADRWAAIVDGHPAVQHDVLVGDNYAKNYTDPRRQAGGGVQPEMAYGPYQIAPGDSIHIVMAEAVAGISWEKGREVGSNWLQWKNNLPGKPALSMPDGTPTTDQNLYKRKWVETGVDSILKTYHNAMKNYNANYNIPKSPPPPASFIVISGGDRIILNWANNAQSDPHFGGYVIYRSQGNVLDRKTEYEKIFECSKSDVVNTFNDITAKRGFDYYYYIQSKDDGTQDGTTLYSGMFWTVTSVPATLQRPSVPSSPNPPNVDSTDWKAITTKGAWISGSNYSLYDVVSYNSLNYVCRSNITNDNAIPDQDNTHWTIATSKGTWVAGSGYHAYDFVVYNGSSYITWYAIAAGKGLDLVRVVPNPYDTRGRFFQFGDHFQYDRIAFYGLPPIAKLKIYTERGDIIWQKDHIRGTGDELWNSTTSSGQIIASGIYILYVETPDGQSVFRKFVVIR